MFTDAGNGHEAYSKDLRFPSVSLYKEPKDLEVPHNLCPERTRPSGLPLCEHDDEWFASALIEARKMNRRTVLEMETTQDQRRLRAGATIEGRRMRPPAEGISPGQ